MAWRRRLAILFSLVVLAAFAAEPMLRSLSHRTLSQVLNREVAVEGKAKLSIQDGTLRVKDVRFHSPSGQSFEIEQVTAKINQKDFLSRNLVVEHATVQGLAIRSGVSRSAPIHRPTQLTPFPQFDVTEWSNSFRSTLEQLAQRLSNQRSAARNSLETRLATLKKRLPNVPLAEQNPLRDRAVIESIRAEFVAIRQSIAEERVALRDIERSLPEEVTQVQQRWASEMEPAITATLPDFEKSIRSSLMDYVNQLLEESEPLLQIVQDSLSPLADTSSKPTNHATQGVDVPIPGFPGNYVLVRSATIQGWLVPFEKKRIPFDCQLSQWGHGKSTIDSPKAHWRFRLPGDFGVVEIAAMRSRPTPSPLATDAIAGELIRMVSQGPVSKPTRVAIDLDRTRWRLAVETPLVARWRNPIQDDSTPAIMGINSEANPLWSSTLMEELITASPDEPLMLRADCTQWRATLLDDQPSVKPTRDVQLDARCLFELEPVWRKAQTRYIRKVTNESIPFSRNIIAKAVQELNEHWAEQLRTQNETLHRLEQEWIILRNQWEESSAVSERLARR
ncbi:MAG: hypothetical protein FJ308_08060 [Planctomycetes bacterium]|nr:hypothetical protein [Planctomycetota bacterium]